MRTVLICHDDDPIDRDGLARWLASFSDLVGIVAIREGRKRRYRRVRREIQRVGLLRFADVLAYRAWYALRWAARDRTWRAEQLARLCEMYHPVPDHTAILHTSSPNSDDARRFIVQCRPDTMLARCKHILAERIFTLPTRATLVMHPGICPEYRNAHGCFWALANDDLQNVGMTLLQVDKGVDTGPVYGYFRCRFDETAESANRIQYRVVLENLPELADAIQRIYEGNAKPLDTNGRASGVWGQPWLSGHLRWKWNAQRRKRHARR